MNPRLLSILIAPALAMGLLSIANGDTLWTGQPNAQAKALEITPIRILKMDANEVVFSTNNNPEVHKSLTQVLRLAIDDEPTLNTAETAYWSSDWDTATDNYLKTLRTTQKPWLKGWCGLRLMDAATRANRLDAAMSGYISLVGADPATAAEHPPKLPDPGSTLLDDAAVQLSSASQDRSLSDTQRAMILRQLLAVHKLRKDSPRAIATAQLLARLNPADTSDLAVMADLRISQAQVSLRAGQFAQAIEQINASQQVFVQPDSQAEALFILAQAAEGVAQASAANPPDGQAAPLQPTDQMRDAAIAYLRVVALFPQNPRAPQSLLATARLFEQMGQIPTALDLYRQAARDYPSALADQQVKRLEGATPPPHP